MPKFRFSVTLSAALTSAALVVLPAVSQNAIAAEQRTFVGFGIQPSDAHADAVAQMQAFSPSCVEISTTFSPAGSAHTWMATLTAEC